ncbi:MAG: rRNA maturation RNase YbeY, partial [Malacoplasma sp.]|nr:rRNA maturation RNase YbeY [Malacoplasma sp.]
VQIFDKKNFLKRADLILVKKIAKTIFKLEKLKGKIIFELHIVNNKESQKINFKYRKKDYPTDVISFSFWEEGLLKTELLGEIFLNYEKVVSQAKQFNHSFERELGFLVSHGIYHLLGYDHEIEADAKIMFGKQYDVLKLCGLGSVNDKN